jgi:galactokinase
VYAVIATAQRTNANASDGIMDMFASIAGVAGHAILLDCRSLEIEAIPVPRDASVLVVDTLVKHDLADGAYAQRRRECEEAATRLGVPSLRDADEAMVRSATGRGLLPPPLDLRALHVASENRRTLEFVAALRAGDLDRLGRLLFEGHASLRDRFEVSCAELDRIVESAASLRAEGAIGARMTGGGFGGCAIVLCRRGTTERVGHEIAAGFRAAFGREPARFAAQAAGGAGVLDAPRSG